MHFGPKEIDVVDSFPPLVLCSDARSLRAILRTKRQELTNHYLTQYRAAELRAQCRQIEEKLQALCGDADCSLPEAYRDAGWRLKIGTNKERILVRAAA